MKINGWLNIDKDLEMSSARVVSIIKRLLSLTKHDKIGHGGTLDPMASGVLPIALGEATKTVSYVMDGKKAYEFSIFFGQERDTGDSEGQVIYESKKIPTLAEIKEILPKLTGKITQVPHKYSALKVDGKRAYDLARSGQEFELSGREINIYSLECTGFNDNIFDFSVECSKGTYIRSLSLDIAKLVNSCGYVYSLRRTRCANFFIKNAISLDFLEKSVNNNEIERFLIPIKDTLDDISGITLQESEAVRIRQGQRLKMPNLNGKGEVLKALCNDELIAIVRADADILHPVRVFNNFNE